MLKTKLLTVLLIAGATMFSACSTTQPEVKESIADCSIEGVEAPSWICNPKMEGKLVDIGTSVKSQLGYPFMQKKAMANGRGNLSQQITVLVKDKVETFMKSTGIGENETVDTVSTMVSKQTSKTTLTGSSQLKVWTSPGNTLYLLVGIDKKEVINSAKRNLKSSFKNDSALWQQFQSENALDKLEEDFN